MKKPGYITYDFLSHFPLPVLFPGGGQRGTNVSHPARISRKAEQISAQYPQNSARKGCNWKNKILIEFVTSVVIPILIENIAETDSQLSHNQRITPVTRRQQLNVV